MLTPKEFEKKAVYVRAVPVEELREELRNEVGNATYVYAVCDSKGNPIALAHGERLAKKIAKNSNLELFSLN